MKPFNKKEDIYCGKCGCALSAPEMFSNWTAQGSLCFLCASPREALEAPDLDTWYAGGYERKETLR